MEGDLLWNKRGEVRLKVSLKLAKYEFRKLWNKVSIIAIVALILLCSIFNLVFDHYISTLSVMKNDGSGDMVSGFGVYRTLREGIKPLEGKVDQNYLDNLVKEYNSSKEKVHMNTDNSALSTKYMSINHVINFAEYAGESSSETFNLDFDFIKSEKEFYQNYKQALVSKIKKENKEYGVQEYSNEQLGRVSEKVDKLEPLTVGYCAGLSEIIYNYGDRFWFLLIVIAFALSSIFSKDSNNGIEELGLSSEFGRKVNMNARIIAGNIFSIVVYIIFWLIQLIERTPMYSLSGLGLSSQMHWFSNFYNLTLGGAFLIMFMCGLVVTLLIGNFVMLISIRFKHSKIAALISVASIYGIVKLMETGNYSIMHLNPIYYATRVASGSNMVPFDIYYFIGDIMMPYSILGLLLMLFYFVIIRVLTIRSYKKYRL